MPLFAIIAFSAFGGFFLSAFFDEKLNWPLRITYTLYGVLLLTAVYITASGVLK